VSASSASPRLAIPETSRSSSKGSNPFPHPFTFVSKPSIAAMQAFRPALLVLLTSISACMPFQRGPSVPPLFEPEGEAMQVIAPDRYKVLFETTQGDFVLEAYRDWAPLGVDRFYNLVSNGYYDGARFFRVLPGFVVQFGIPGDPDLSAIWSEQRIQDDPVTESNRRGYVSFATAGPNSRTAQVFINLADNSRLDPMGFAPFARIVGGMDIIDALYAEYGEGAPQGRGPSQDRIEQEGNPYLEAEFPELDYIYRARVIPETM
jgi:peptidyl-prolyl cis-trans isomerase A (cyclophilin A)